MIMKNFLKDYWAEFGKAKLRKLDKISVPDSHDEVFLFSKVRDEYSRMPFFIKYYRTKGVDRFFFIDNGSKDRTTEYLLSQPNTHVFSTDEKLSSAECGMKWIESLLQRYGVGHWCVIADDDHSLETQ